MTEPGAIPFSKESIEQIQRDITELSGVLGFLLQLKYTDTLTVSMNGATSKVVYDPDDSNLYDNVYWPLADQYRNKMRDLVYDMHKLINQER
jgi:hypothetical protein